MAGMDYNVANRNSGNNRNNRNSRNDDKLEEGNNLINAPLEYWAIVGVLWVLLGIFVLWTTAMSIIAFIGYLILFVAWIYYNWTVVSEKENAVSVCWGKMNALSSSGPVIVLRGIEKLLIYSTSAQQITFEKEAGIYTRTGKSMYDKKEILQSILLPVKIAINFTWPITYEELRRTVKFAPPPTKKGLRELADLLEELFLDIVRTVGGKYTYEEISQQRTTFAQEVADVINGKEILVGEGKGEAQQLQEMITLFRLGNLTVSLKHIEIPTDLEKAMEKRAAAFSLGEASRIEESSKRFGIAEGEAEIRRALTTVLNELGPNALKLEAFLTLVKTAQEGKSTYMILPEQVYRTISQALGGSSDQALEESVGKKLQSTSVGLSEEDLQKMFESVMKRMGK